MIFKRKIGPKGKVEIPQELRELLNIRLGSEVLIEVRNDEIVIRNLIGEEFLKKFIDTPKKFFKKMDFKHTYDQQYEGS